MSKALYLYCRRSVLAKSSIAKKIGEGAKDNPLESISVSAVERGKELRLCMRFVVEGVSVLFLLINGRFLSASEMADVGWVVFVSWWFVLVVLVLNAHGDWML